MEKLTNKKGAHQGPLPAGIVELLGAAVPKMPPAYWRGGLVLLLILEAVQIALQISERLQN